MPDIDLEAVVRELARLSDKHREEIDELNERFTTLAFQLNRALRLLQEVRDELASKTTDDDEWWKHNGN